MPTSAEDWPQFGYDARHSGNNTAETAIGIDNVASLVPLYSTSVPIGVSLVYAGDVAIGSATKQLLFSNDNGQLIAYDAANGHVLWSQQTSPNGLTQSTPAVDAANGFVYNYGADGKVHKFHIADGAEVVTQSWPEVATLKPSVEHGASPLTIATTPSGRHYLYVVNNGYNGDGGDYQGHVTAIDLTTGAQKVFNIDCSDNPIHFLLDGAAGVSDCADRQGGIWGRAGATYDAVTDRLYIASGNGHFDANVGGHNWGDSVLALSPDGSGLSLGRPLDSYTPTNYDELDGYDRDLGSGSPVIVPTPTASRIPHLGLQVGKDGVQRLLNLDNLSGHSGPGFVGGEVQPLASAQGFGAPTPQPATWIDPADQSTWVFVPARKYGLLGMQLVLDASNTPSLTLRWTQAGWYASPVIANGVVYAPQAWGDLLAIDAHSGNVLWTLPDAGVSPWGGPIVVEGRLFIADGSRLQALALDELFRDSFD